MLPLCVAAGLTFSGRRWRAGIAQQPEANIVRVILFAPDHSGERLPLHQASVGVVHAGLNSCVEFIALADSGACDLIEAGKGRRILNARKAQPEPRTRTGIYPRAEMRTCLGATQQRVHRRPIALHKVLVKGVFVIALS